MARTLDHPQLEHGLTSRVGMDRASVAPSPGRLALLGNSRCLQAVGRSTTSLGDDLIAIARTVSAVWKQEKMAGQAREIAELGKELYARLSTMGGHVGRMGKNLDTAVSAYNALVGSLESQVLTQAKRFEELNIDTGGKAIEALPIVEQTTRPLVKLVSGGEQT